MESFVARCVDAGDHCYREELERLCALHPSAATELRERIAHLEQLGFVGSAAPTASRWLPERIGGFHLQDLLGRGGMGVVFRAIADDGTEVALKVIRPDLLEDSGARERFRREGLMASRIAHPGICAPLALGVDDGVPWMAMPLLDGWTLAKWMQQARRETTTVLGHIESWARALHAAHELGLVHRDVTPGNLFITADGRALVLDFGLARDTADDGPKLTRSHEQIGTLHYMAPEQLRGGRIDRRCDVYSLGIVLFEALAGRLPFAGRARTDISKLIASGATPRLRHLVPTVPRQLARIVERAMDVDPEQRYAAAAELADDLRRHLQGDPVRARGISVPLRLRRWSRNHPLASTTIALLSLLVVVAGLLLVRLQDEVRVHRATAATLVARTLERADPMRAIEQVLAAHASNPTPATLGQLNRLLHNVSMLSTASLPPAPIRRIAVHRIDDRSDRVAVAVESALCLLTLDRSDGTMRESHRLAVDSTVLLRCVRFSPDGKFVACGGSGKTAYVAATTAPALRRLGGAKGEVFDVEVDNAGSVIAVVVSGQVLSWSAGQPDAAPRTLLDLREKPLGPNLEPNLRGMRRGPDGDLLLWNWTYALRMRPDGSVAWQVAPAGQGSGPMVAEFDAQNEHVLLGQAGHLRLVRWADGHETWAPKLSSPSTDCAIARDGTVASLHADGTLRLWQEGTEVAHYRDPGDHLVGVLAVLGGEGFLVAGRGGSQRRLDGLGRVQCEYSGGDVERWGVPGPFAWSTDASVLLAAGGPGRLRTWDFDGSRGESQFRLVASPPVAIAPHPDGLRVIVLTDDRRGWLWQPSTTAPLAIGSVPLNFRAHSTEQRGDGVAFGGMNQDGYRVALFDADSDTFRTPVIFEPKQQFGAVGIAWLPHRTLAVAFGDNRFAASRISFATGTGTNVPIAAAAIAEDIEVPLSVGRLTCMDAARDGQRLVVGCTGGGLHLYENTSGDMRYRLSRSWPTAGRVWSIDISADGQRATAGIEDGSVLLWTIDTPDTRILVPARGRPARSMFAHGDSLVIEFVPDGLARVWNADGSSPAIILEAATGDGAVVRDAAVLTAATAAGKAPDIQGLTLVTAGSDGWLRTWSFDGNDLARRASERLAALRAR